MGHLFKITLLLHPDFSQNVSCFNVHKSKQGKTNAASNCDKGGNYDTDDVLCYTVYLSMTFSAWCKNRTG